MDNSQLEYLKNGCQRMVNSQLECLNKIIVNWSIYETVVEGNGRRSDCPPNHSVKRKFYYKNKIKFQIKK